MWQVENHTPFSAQGYFVRDQHGFEHWVTGLRASFRIGQDGRVEIADNQESLKLSPVYADGNSEELAVDGDLVPFRPNTDLTFSGVIVSPGGKEFKHLVFGFHVNNVSKVGVAFGHRRIIKRRSTWYSHLEEAVTSVPLSWRMAMGGRDPFSKTKEPGIHEQNPIGKGWSRTYENAADGDILDLPEIESYQQLFHPSAPPPPPFGLSPIQPSWRPRLNYAGTYDARWERHRAPLLPEDFSPRFYNAAPADQILPLRGGEQISLHGFHPDGSYRFVLPHLFFRATTLLDGQHESSAMRLIAVQIDATNKLLSMVWNTHVPCNGRDHKVYSTKIVMKQVVGAIA